jgi:hypothetical protein
MRSPTIDPATVPGWGVDADPDNDPTWPMRDRSGDDGLRSDWARPELQAQEVELLQSIEHVRRPAVFGTSTPPRGLSGMLRRAAFSYSESHWLHWLMLMGADRINVVEGVVEDLATGKLPNVPGEMGARAEWAHNKRGFVIKAAATVAVTAALLSLVGSRRREPSPRLPGARRGARQAARAMPLPPQGGGLQEAQAHPS